MSWGLQLGVPRPGGPQWRVRLRPRPGRWGCLRAEAPWKARRPQLGGRERLSSRRCKQSPLPACQPPAQDHLSPKELAPSRVAKDSCPHTHPSVSLIRPPLLPGRPLSSALPHSSSVQTLTPLSRSPSPAQGAPTPLHLLRQPDLAPSAVGRGLQVTCLQPSTLMFLDIVESVLMFGAVAAIL